MTRLRMRVVALVLAGGALTPAFEPYTAFRIHGDRVCLAALHGWQAEHPEPSEEDLAELNDALTVELPAPDALRDPAVREAFVAAERARQATPGFRRAEAYVSWRTGVGACVPEGRHRLILTGTALVAAAAFAVVARRLVRAVEDRA